MNWVRLRYTWSQNTATETNNRESEHTHAHGNKPNRALLVYVFAGFWLLLVAR